MTVPLERAWDAKNRNKELRYRIVDLWGGEFNLKVDHLRVLHRLIRFLVLVSLPDNSPSFYVHHFVR